MDPIPTLHQKDLHLDTNMRDQFYIGTQIFIHHNLVEYKNLPLFMWLPYHDTTTLYNNLVICFLRPLMPWYSKRGGEHPYL